MPRRETLARGDVSGNDVGLSGIGHEKTVFWRAPEWFAENGAGDDRENGGGARPFPEADAGKLAGCGLYAPLVYDGACCNQ